MYFYSHFSNNSKIYFIFHKKTIKITVHIFKLENTIYNKNN